MTRQDGVFSGWQVAITRWTDSDSKPYRSSAAAASVAYPLPVIAWVKDPAELVDAGGKPGMKPHVPDESILRLEVDGIGPRVLSHALGNELFGLLLRHHAFRHVGHHAGIAGVGMDGVPVIRGEVANPQSFGFDGQG